ncbi:MAG: hypothetical protein ACKVX9_20970 [Blastocatellia bacterium]
MRQIFGTALALQFFVAASLCAGVCCGSAPAGESRHREAVGTKEENGHCHPKSQAARIRQAPAERPSCHETIAGGPAHELRETTSARMCACELEREEPRSGGIVHRPFEFGSNAAGMPPPAIASLRSTETPPRGASITNHSAHSPPYSGSSLHLRI